VIAAAPVKPVAAIVTTRMIPGKPKPAIFLTSSSILLTFAVYLLPLPTRLPVQVSSKRNKLFIIEFFILDSIFFRRTCKLSRDSISDQSTGIALNSFSTACTPYTNPQQL
jgi:hypothetical protein